MKIYRITFLFHEGRTPAEYTCPVQSQAEFWMWLCVKTKEHGDLLRSVLVEIPK